MDDYRGGKFIVGNDVRLSEQTRQAGEFLRNRGEDFRNGNEYTRNEIASRSIGAAENYSRSSFLTQIGMFIALLLSIIIIATIAGLAYNKAYNNTSLVNLNNLTLSNLTVNDNSDLNTLNLTGDLTSIGGISTTSGLSVGGKAYFYDDFVLEEGLSINGGLSVGGKSNFYDDVNINGDFTTYGDIVGSGGLSINGGLFSGPENYFGGDTFIRGGGLSITGGLSVGGKAYFDSDVFIEGGLSINGAGDIGVCHFLHGNLEVTGNLLIDGDTALASDVYIGDNANIFANTSNLILKNIYASGGLSVGTSAYFSDNVFITGGLSVGTSAYFDSDVFIEGGLSINGAGDIGVCHFIHGNLEVSGDLNVDSNLYFSNSILSDNTSIIMNSLLGDIGATGTIISNDISTVNTLTVGGKSQLKKLNTKVITDADINGDMSGLSGVIGYNLSSSESGTIYLVTHGDNIDHANIRFNLPSAVEAENYKFLWKNGLCYPDNKQFVLSTTNSENLYGTVSLNEDNSAYCYSIHASANPSALPNAKNLTLNGVIYPGSVIDCISDGTSWFINSNIGISYLISVAYDGAYKITGNIDGNAVLYAFVSL